MDWLDKMPRTYEAITTQTLGSNQASITLSSIPATYTDLILVFVGWGNGGGGSVKIRPNNDTNTLYNTTYLYGDGSSVTPGQTGDTAEGTFMGRINTNSTDSGGGYIHIMNYANTTTFKSMIGTNFASAPIVWYSLGMYRSTNAITSLNLRVESGSDFATGFTVTLYGIKAA
jgi:hypothetical protein